MSSKAEKSLSFWEIIVNNTSVAVTLVLGFIAGIWKIASDLSFLKTEVKNLKEKHSDLKNDLKIEMTKELTQIRKEFPTIVEEVMKYGK